MSEIQSAGNNVQLNNGDLLVFVGLSTENSDALKYSHLFSTLAASAQFYPTTEGQQWFQTYLQTMQTCGWLPIKYSYTKEVASSQNLSVKNLLVKAVQAGLGYATGGATTVATLVNVARDAVDTLAKSPEATTLFERTSAEKEGTALSMAVCTQHANGEVLLSVGCMQSTESPPGKTNVLVFEWSSSHSDTYTGAAALSFHRGLYDQVKDTLIERVGDKSKKDVLTLSIEPKKRS
ncbi:hypothetical protein [Pseudomonas alkylphenolica]|uniref:Uncharacterized protein n=1 Tax=Pseudomonas alkylphenolica TaxID=237609 RepID=A0A077FF51_9PSED|nr:hypothetical protein [Pseudomonas alkylphenolica]AIL63868.1 hypothetical protein PSAKL28_47280 [Pseudomonas alkylphenolica]